MSALRLVRRQLAASRGASVALAVVVLLAAAVLSAWPRAVAQMHADQAAAETASTSVVQRDVVSVVPGVPGAAAQGDPDATAAAWSSYLHGLDAVRAARPEPLRSALGEGDFATSLHAVDMEAVPGNDVRFPSVVLRAAPGVGDHVEVVAGRWPAASEVVLPDARAGDAAGSRPQGEVEVALSQEAADVLGWELGSVHLPVPSALPALRLVGTYAPTDADDPYWAHNPTATGPQVVDDLNTGVSALATAYVDPSMLGAAAAAGSPTTRVWFPLDAAALTDADVAPLLAQLRALTATQTDVGYSTPVPGGSEVVSGSGEGVARLSPSTEITGVLEQVLAQRAGADAILAVVAAGPLGVTVAVLALGARLVVARRRAALALVRARGGSGLQLRGVMALEGLVVGVPAAAAGLGVAHLVVPGPPTTTSVLLTLGAALAPAVLLAAATSPRGLREERTDLGVRSRGRARWVVEVLVVVAAAASVALLLQRGVVAGSASGASGASDAAAGVDPLLAAAPLLLALAACVVVLRLYPWPVRALSRVLARGRGLVGFLGSARAVRDTAGGLVPALALVVGVAVAGFSTVMYSTVQAGVQQQAWDAVGADVRLSGPIVDADGVARLAGLDGVAAVSAVADLGDLSLKQGVAGEKVGVVAVDAETFAQVQADVPGAPSLPAGLGADGDRLPVLVSPATGVAPGTDGVRLLGTQGADVDVVGTVDDVPGLRTRAAFVLVDADRAAELLGSAGRARVALLALDDGADPAAVVAQVREAYPNGVVETPGGVAAERLGTPVSAGLDTAFWVAAVLAGLLCAAAVVMTQMVAAPARARLLAVLRTLGLRPRQAQGLVAWELGPWALVSLLVGAALGVAVPALVLATVDLTPFTGGDAQPPLSVDPLLLAAVAGGFLLVVAAAVAVSAALSRRGDVAAELRTGEER